MPRAIRTIAFIVGGIVALVIVAVAIVVGQSNTRLAQTYDIGEVAVPDIPTDEESLAEGRRLFQAYGCAECHGSNGGGQVFIDDPAMGVLISQNLTTGAGGIANDYETVDWVRSIRHGIRPDGTGIQIMPSEDWIGLSSEDMGQLVAYIESLEPVDNELPEISYGPVGRVLTATGQLAPSAASIDHNQPHPESVDRSTASLELGEYLISNCTGCHMGNLAGGEILGAPPDWPAASNLTPHESGIDAYELEDFDRALRQGISPSGNALNPEAMPWPAYTAFTDIEVESLWMYLEAVEPVDTSEDS